MRLLRKDKYKQ